MVLKKNEPGTELFSREATLQVSSPLQRFTVEFGMESKWDHCADSTRKARSTANHLWFWLTVPSRLHNPKYSNFLSYLNQRSSPRSVSTPWLQTLLLFHLAPINGCSPRDLTGLLHESTHLEVGFPLRCFQRLSAPHLATQRLPLAR